MRVTIEEKRASRSFENLSMDQAFMYADVIYVKISSKSAIAMYEDNISIAPFSKTDIVDPVDILSIHIKINRL